MDSLSRLSLDANRETDRFSLSSKETTPLPGQEERVDMLDKGKCEETDGESKETSQTTVNIETESGHVDEVVKVTEGKSESNDTTQSKPADVEKMATHKIDNEKEAKNMDVKLPSEHDKAQSDVTKAVEPSTSDKSKQNAESEVIASNKSEQTAVSEVIKDRENVETVMPSVQKMKSPTSSHSRVLSPEVPGSSKLYKTPDSSVEDFYSKYRSDSMYSLKGPSIEEAMSGNVPTPQQTEVLKTTAKQISLTQQELAKDLKFLVADNWTDFLAPGNLVSLCVTSRHVWCVDKSEGLHYSALSGPGLRLENTMSP